MSDNWNFDIRAKGDAHLSHAVALAFGVHTKATHYAVASPDGCPTLILLWTAYGDAIKLPFALNAERAVTFINSWLEDTDYPEVPEHDGHSAKGWRVFNETWGHVHGMWEAFVAIQPAWMFYGK